jgi:hypothetical protein
MRTFADPSPDARARKFIDTAFADIAARNGLGSDDHWHTPTLHPMADARLISAAAALLRCGAVSAASAHNVFAASASRLEQSAIVTKWGTAWGLNFPWHRHDAPVDEPYVVTTAFVAQALGEAADLGYAPARHLAGAVQTTLLDWPRLDGLPIYSPKVPRLVANAVALWARCVCGAIDTAAAVDFVESHYVALAGWKYAPDKDYVDLIHNSYILDAMRVVRGASFAKPRAFALLSFFRGAEEWNDSARIKPLEKAPATKHEFRLLHDAVAIYAGRAARPKSLGEMLGAVAGFSFDDEQDALQSALRELFEVTLDACAKEDGTPRELFVDVDGNLKPRNLAHVVYGFARAIEAGRAGMPSGKIRA